MRYSIFMNSLRPFLLPAVISLFILVVVLATLGSAAFFTALLLVVLEVTLSFDNAVVNAKILGRMTARWQKRFLTWGIVIAVFGTRLVLPILIVSASAKASPLAISKLAILDPAAYGALLQAAHASIAAFGAAFLLMVALHYFFDVEKDVHWIRVLERRLVRIGRIEAIEIVVTLAVLLLAAMLVPAHALSILTAGSIGVISFILIQGIANLFTLEADGSAAESGLALFLYLNVLDAAFSLDGVVGAFAITTLLPVIVVGLGIGAYFVRSITLYLVRRKTLDTLAYLEHGAHYAILGLALSLFASLFIPVPEAVTGLIGIAFVGASLFSSLRERAK